MSVFAGNGAVVVVVAGAGDGDGAQAVWLAMVAISHVIS
jgi:hypothetical protein